MPVTILEPGDPAKRTILIVDDHPVLRRGLTALIDFEPDLIVCGEAATYPAALEAIQAHQPDLVIVDLELGKRDGLNLVKDIKIRHPLIPSLVLTMHDEVVYAERSLRAGAAGYVTKQQLDETLLIAIRCVLAGEIYMSDQLQGQLAKKYLGLPTLASGSSLNSLSDRELQVFRLIGEGRATRQIAEDLSLSIKTIESHREHIKSKLNLDSAAQLAHRATQWVDNGGTG
jgi:DNA-binding NarL/FixJ family response regulator